MAGNGDGLDDLRLGDLSTFLAVRSAGSVTHAARAMRVTPSQVSKAIARLESALRVQLLTRGARGVALSEAGHRVAPMVEDAVARLRAIQRTTPIVERELTIAAPSWLAVTMAPRIAAALVDVRVRIIELPPSRMRALAGENMFDMALLPGDNERLPASWVCARVGEVRKGLFAAPSLGKKLGAAPVDAETVKTIPFVGHIFNSDGAFVAVGDDCPIPRSDRRIGHEAQTFAVGLEIAARTNQLVFGPAIAARAHIDSGAIVEVRVKGWNLRDPLQIACDGGRVLSRVQTMTAKAVRDGLAELDP